jgi:hypothetical protein
VECDSFTDQPLLCAHPRRVHAVEFILLTRDDGVRRRSVQRHLDRFVTRDELTAA